MVSVKCIALMKHLWCHLLVDSKLCVLSVLFLLQCQLKRPQSSYVFCRDKYACRDKTFVATGVCLWRQNIFVATKLLFVAADILLSRQKTKFVATKVSLSRQKTCFVAANTCLSRQKWYLWQLPPMIVDNLQYVSVHNTVSSDNQTKSEVGRNLVSNAQLERRVMWRGLSWA